MLKVYPMPILMAFTAQQTSRLANISDRMLRYWENTGVFRPEYVRRRDHGPFRKIYSFRDLVSLRTLALLRKVHKLPLDELRKASEYLDQFAKSPWSELSLRVTGRHLVFRNPETGLWTRTDASGQTVMTIDLKAISEASERDARVMMLRSPDQIGEVTRNRYIMSNAWVLAGTRIPIDAVLDLANAGYDDAEILRQYPTLHRRDIDAARAFVPPAKAA